MARVFVLSENPDKASCLGIKLPIASIGSGLPWYFISKKVSSKEMQLATLEERDLCQPRPVSRNSNPRKGQKQDANSRKILANDQKQRRSPGSRGY